MDRDTRLAAFCYLLLLAGVLATLWLNARMNQVSVVSWQSAGLLGIAAAVALVSYLVVRWLSDRIG